MQRRHIVLCLICTEKNAEIKRPIGLTEAASLLNQILIVKVGISGEVVRRGRNALIYIYINP